MGLLTDPIIAAAERRARVEMPYLRTLAGASPAAFAKWLAAMPAALHRSAAPLEAWHLARLGATLAQDCGTCVQTVVNAAVDDGVAGPTLRAALAGGEGLDEPHRVALEFGRAVGANSDDVAVWVERVEARFGHAAHVEMAMAVALVQIFPLVKRGLGQAVACSLVTVEV